MGGRGVGPHEGQLLVAAGLGGMDNNGVGCGEAGKRQVKGNPRKGVAQAWGDLMQVGTVVVMGR